MLHKSFTGHDSFIKDRRDRFETCLYRGMRDAG